MRPPIDSLPVVIALASAVLGLAALTLAVVLAVKVKRLRRAQVLVLGEHEERDLVAHAQALELGFGELRELVEQSLANAEQRLSRAEIRLDGCVAYRSLVRYDAYGEMSGRQSSSVALLDSHRSGIVISSILHREHGRVYVKQVREGASELELSPEELEAIEAALAEGFGPAESTLPAEGPALASEPERRR